MNFLLLCSALLLWLDFFTVNKLCNSSNHCHKKRKDSLDRVLRAAELEFPKILVIRLPQYTSNVNIECAGKSEWPKQQYYLYMASFSEHWYILILLFWYLFLIYDAWYKLCNIRLLLCENNFRSITIPELNTGGKYCWSYYSRQGDRN